MQLKKYSPHGTRCEKCGGHPRLKHQYTQHSDILACECQTCGYSWAVKPLDSSAPPDLYDMLRKATDKTRARTIDRIASAVRAAVEGKPGQQLEALIRKYGNQDAFSMATVEALKQATPQDDGEAQES